MHMTQLTSSTIWYRPKGGGAVILLSYQLLLYCQAQHRPKFFQLFRKVPFAGHHVIGSMPAAKEHHD